jgi:uncharacterized protein YwqG/predicted DNA-binding protein (MmcQ/YjbR family)
MPTVKQLIRELAKYAMAKRGARQDLGWCLYDVLEAPHVDLPGATWGNFFEADENADGPFARLPVLADALKRHRKKYPVIRPSPWMERDGHVYMEVPLEAGVPVGSLKALIDEAYALVWNKLDANARMKVQLAGQPYDEPKLLDQLAEMHGLKGRRKVIRKLARPAVLLRTKKSSEAKIPPGATRIGGRPDLPAKREWPAYRDGKPLAFLAQINLAEVAKVGAPIKGLPAAGLLSVFSVWGWMKEDDFDPQVPHDGTEGNQEESGWTVALHTPARVKLERRKTPRGVNAFRAAAVEATPTLSLPNHRAEPPLAALGWSDDEYERFDEMQSDFRSVQMGHWLKNSDVFASHHLLGGYALFQQHFPEEVLEKGLAMFLQIGTDGKTGMHWGDGGELTFYADARGLAKGRFERLWGTCQGG